MSLCQNKSPKLGIPCGKQAHPERIACAAQGQVDGVHWSLTWWKIGHTGDQRADGQPWDHTDTGTGEVPTQRVGEPGWPAPLAVG